MMQINVDLSFFHTESLKYKISSQSRLDNVVSGYILVFKLIIIVE